MDSTTEVTLSSKTLRELFAQPLRVPNYQREYAWQPTHVLDLMNDILARAQSSPRSAYHMGTVILHSTKDADADCLDIVDGQQRLVTLTILLREVRKELSGEQLPLLEGEFSSASAARINRAQDATRAFLQRQTGSAERLRAYLWKTKSDASEGTPPEGVLFNVLTLSGGDALDRAYTFFDSVNSKGMRLTDFDLLKAHHLMFIPAAQESLAARHNDAWQAKDDAHERLFSLTLRRLRMWNRGQDRDTRGERADYGEFCSVVEPDECGSGEHAFNRYMQPAAFRSWRRVNDRVVLSMDYPAADGEALLPTEVTQTIEGGDAFFLYAHRYHQLYAKLFSTADSTVPTDIAFVRKLSAHIDNGYLQNAFRAVMLLYFDKFGEDRLIEAAVLVERLVSVYRWRARSVRIEGTLSHVKGMNLVPVLLTAFNACHAVVQLRKGCEACDSLMPLPDLTAVQRRYFDRLREFYLSESVRARVPARAESVIAHFLDNR